MPKSIKRPALNPWAVDCPSRAVLGTLASKWVLLVMPLLREKPLRNGEILRRVQGISQKSLTQTLRELESKGLIERQDFQEVPPRVEYGLTELGRSLEVALKIFDDWVIANAYVMEDWETARSP